MPNNFDGFIGNENGVMALQLAVLAAKQQSRPVPHVLLIGSAGVGKTTLARIVANMMGGKFRDITGGNLRSMEDVVRYILPLGFRGVLFVDEIHMLSPSIQDVMLPLMEEFRLPYNGGMVCIPPLTIIGATTEPSKLDKPYQDRFKYTIHLQRYTVTEIRKILQNIIDYATIEPEALDLLASICRNTAREAVSNGAVRLKDVCLACKTQTITCNIILEMMKVHGINELGLKDAEVVYLRMLATGPQSYSTLKAKCGAVLLDESEEYLLYLGFIEKGSRGRSITRAGLLYLAQKDRGERDGSIRSR